MAQTYVYLHLPEGHVPVGILDMNGEGRSAT